MIALCRKAGAIASERFSEKGWSRLCDGQETGFPTSDADQRNRTFNLLIKSRRIRNRRAPHFCTERINDLPIAKLERKRLALVLKRRELAYMGSNGTAHLWPICGPRISAF
jgi:hypothetical protein